MKLFQLIQKNYEILGISSIEAEFSQRKLVMTSLVFGLTTTSSCAFLIFQANTFNQFTMNIYISSACVIICIAFTIIALNQEKFFKLIDDYEKFIHESE